MTTGQVRPKIEIAFGSLSEWGEWINEHAEARSPDANRAVLVGSGGQPATRDELIAFVAEQNARYRREHDNG